VNYTSLAREIVELDDSIAIAMIVKRGNLLGSFAKPRIPIPHKEKFTEMFLQVEIMLSIPTSNEGVFGKVEDVAVKHGLLHVHILPLPNQEVLAFGTNAKSEVNVSKVLKDIFFLIKNANLQE